jgi:hypothetical protein
VSPKSLALTAGVALAVVVAYEKYGHAAKAGAGRIGN